MVDMEGTYEPIILQVLVLDTCWELIQTRESHVSATYLDSKGEK